MSTATHDPATPIKTDDFQYFGLTALEYAAIKLRVPDSGTEWLDAMIRKSIRDRYVEIAMQSVLSDELANRAPYDEDTGEKIDTLDDPFLGAICHDIADHMLKARDA